ncbi:MAG TPA: hypothetical protein VHA10_21085 [Hypericibacter adhaerens]|jgi:hypothetical protein|uniref:Uncharacterized protein n=1 Tax=Hypericibacter adhaerens TaxID=2602016 RepID=A0A5J6NB02_9PROT|nr:hypothetical protein [Hypericibacter adhaerens]QEX25126.1 hypothetical protein FRZ61_50720 [Hypericibacter adhaerens]HWA45727.1 hypothetical protein [Hypericibacter adhaerens]
MAMTSPNQEPTAPIVLCTTVVRSAHHGSSHGGAYLVDLVTGRHRQVLDWNDGSIDWSGRGGGRGLRGIAFHGEEIYIAASDEIFVYDREFRVLRSFRHPCLDLCHEIFIAGDRLYLTATGFDSILVHDLAAGRFIEGHCLRRDAASGRLLYRRFDPAGPELPEAGDSTHINNVFVAGDRLYVGGVNLDRLIELHEGRATAFARLPTWTHNARPFAGGIIANSTQNDCILIATRDGRPRLTLPVPRYPVEQLQNADLPVDFARQAFGRGLAIIDENHIVAGSSPATLTLWRLAPTALLARVNLSLDIRNAVHGLAIWPFGRTFNE